MSRPQQARLSDIAKRAGVSRAAVGHILNQTGQGIIRVSEETRAKVIRIAADLNYRPNRAAQQLRGRPTRMLGVILDTVNKAVFSARLSAVEEEAHRRGYRLIVGQVHQDPKAVLAYLDDFSSRGIEGVLCLFDVMQGFRKDLQSIFQHHPGVVIHAAPIVADQPCVRVDTAEAVRQLVDHLVERGRSRIGLQLWSLNDSLMSVRHQSWQKAVARHKLSSADELVWVNPTAAQRPTPEVIDDCIRKLVLEQKADAILASNDEWGVRMIQRLHRVNIDVPGDVAVTGYDNLDIADVIEPGLTTIDQCHEDYAAAAVELMLSMRDRKSSSTEEITRVVQPKLVIREST